MGLVYQRATERDIDTLVRTRVAVLRAANKLSDQVDMSLVETESYAYYAEYLNDGRHVAYLVFYGSRFVGAGGISFFRVMPTYHNPTGRKAYVMNMYTDPGYRRQGIAMKTLDLLIQETVGLGITDISLEATDMGRPLYEKYGFTQKIHEMEFLQP